MSLFLRNLDTYKRNMDPIDGYKKSLVQYAVRKKGITEDEAMARVEKAMQPGGPLEPKDPVVHINSRKKARTDRAHEKTTMSQVLGRIKENDYLLSPSFTAYERPERYLAHQPQYIDVKKKERKVVKKKGQYLGQKGDDDAATILNSVQNNLKTRINSISGATQSEYNPNYLASGHPSLTSTSRVLTSNSNSVVERLIAGRRHYYDADIVLENILATIRLVDMPLISRALREYGITVPSVEEVCGKIAEACADYYCRPDLMEHVYQLIGTLSMEERSAVYYVSDLKSFMDLSPEFTRAMFDKLTFLSGERCEPLSVEQTWSEMDKADDYAISYISTLMSPYLQGKVLSDLAEDEPKTFGLFGAYLVRFTRYITEEYMLLIRAFFTTDLMPQSIHAFPGSVREATIGSDTDSTLFTMQTVIEWYFGKLQFGYEADCARELATYWDSQCVRHTLAKVSAQLGIEKEHLLSLNMKPEFSMPVMVFTNRMKHYVSMTSMKEGNLYSKLELDIKGVALRNSKVQPWVLDIFNKWVTVVCDRFIEQRPLHPLEIVSVPTYLEHFMIQSLHDGTSTFLMNAQINTEATYKNPMSSAWYYKLLWDEVFAPKYGYMGEAPIATKKVNVGLDGKTKINRWLETIDPIVAERMRAFLEKTGRDKLKMFLVPTSFLEQNKMPEELWVAMHVDTMLIGVMESFYYFLECAGIYFRNKKMTRMLYREIPLESVKPYMLLEDLKTSD